MAWTGSVTPPRIRPGSLRYAGEPGRRRKRAKRGAVTVAEETRLERGPDGRKGAGWLPCGAKRGKVPWEKEGEVVGGPF